MEAAPPPRLRSVITLSLTGVLLLLAAGLKAVSDPTTGAVVPGVSASWLHLVSVAYQIALGSWLASGAARPGAWLAAVVTFTAFLAVSLYNVRVGSASCGCFGELSVHPWWVAGLDAAVLVALLTIGRSGGSVRKAVAPAALFAANFGLIVGLLSLWAASRGSTELALVAVRSETVVVSPAVLDFGSAAGGETVEASATVHNRSRETISVVGGTSDCSCATVGPLPVEVPPGESRAVTIRLRLPAEAGQVRRTSQLWTDAPGHKAKSVGLVGRSSGGL